MILVREERFEIMLKCNISAEGVSHPTSPTTHLQHVFGLPLQVKKRKTISKSIIYSLSEQKDLFKTSNNNKKHIENAVGFEAYMMDKIMISAF